MKLSVYNSASPSRAVAIVVALFPTAVSASVAARQWLTGPTGGIGLHRSQGTPAGADILDRFGRDRFVGPAFHDSGIG